MIASYFEDKFKQGKLLSSWLIDSDNTEKVLEDLEGFIINILRNNGLNNHISDYPLNRHPDYQLISRENSSAVNSKNISIEQIRNLQDFFYKSSVVSGYKIAVIYQADLMNLNAANCCLKILEEPPNNSYLFLVTSKPSIILKTIRSRCAKINFKSFAFSATNEQYLKFLAPIANFSNANIQLNFIKEFSEKNRALLLEFADSLLYLVSRLIKKRINIDVELNPLENEILNKFPSIPPSILIQKYNKIRKLAENTANFDLDLRASCILLLNELT